MRLPAQEFAGRSILTADGHIIGELSLLFVDSDSWRVAAIQAKLRNPIADQLGASRGMFHAGTIKTPMDMVQSVGDAVILSVSQRELRRVLPGEPKHEAPAASRH